MLYRVVLYCRLVYRMVASRMVVGRMVAGRMVAFGIWRIVMLYYTYVPLRCHVVRAARRNFQLQLCNSIMQYIFFQCHLKVI